MSAGQGAPLPVPIRTSLLTGAYLIASHGPPPPPVLNQSPPHVLAARSSSLVSKPFLGLPGTMYQRHSSLPVSASDADMKPRWLNSEPASPMNTRPSAIRGAPVIE